jgi:hypothetical protein
MQILFAIVIGMCTTALYAQDVEKGQIEATGQVGVVAGLGTHASVGGSVGRGATDHIFVVGEFSYIPLGGGRVESFGFQSGGSAKSYGFNFMGQYHFRSAGSSVAPYGGAGLAVLHSSVNFSSTVGGVSGGVSSSDTDAYLSLGGGFRYYSSDRWGFKPELMVFIGSNSFVRIGGGVFYQFGK